MLQSSLNLIGIEKVASVDYLEKVMACYREGRVAVPCDADTQLPAGYAFREMLKPEAGGGWFTRAQAPIHDANPAQVSFSSGTTGMPKAILLSHRALGDVTDRLVAAMEVDSDIREYLGVPPTYSFGLGRARVVSAVGGQLFVPSRGFDPMEFARMLEAGEVNALSAAPTLLRALMSIPDLFQRRVARQLRWLEIGSQPMSAEEKQMIRRIFPAARIIQHYGLTEASRTTFLDIQEASAEELETVGRPIGQTEIRIDAEDRICIRGPHVADGILTSDGLQPLVDNDGWLTTNDLGRIDDHGFLTFLGRIDHLLNVGGIKVSAELFEQRLTERLGADAAHVAVAARPDTLRGQTVMVAHLPALSPAMLSQHARAVGASMGLSAPDVVLVEVPEIPRTDTGKIQRALLTERHGAAAISTLAVVPTAEAAPAAASSHPPTAATGMNERERQIAAIWEEALGVSPIGRDESFFDIGGDSLSAITVMIRMERAGVPKALTQQIFEGRTIAQIAADAERTETIGVAPTETGGARGLRAVTTDAISMTRALLVMLVIVNHWSPFLFTRMGEAGSATFHSLVPLFRAGTPGFAIVFGLGLGYFQAPVARRTPERLASWRRARVLIIGSSILLLGLIRGIDHYLSASGLGSAWPAQLFFGVLCFYLLMVATAPWWLRIIVRAPYPIAAALAIMSASYLLSDLFRYLWLDAQLGGLLDLGRLLLVTRYSYPEMLGHVMIGVTIGLWIGLNDERPDLPRVAAWGGLVTLLGGLMLSLRGDTIHWFDDVATVPQVLTYAGGALLVFSFAFAQARRTNHSRAGLRAMRLLVVIGLLALPAYVGHEGVEPLVDLLTNAGLHHGLATAIPVLAFVIAISFAMQRVYRLYYRSAD